MLGGRLDPFTRPITKQLRCKVPKSAEAYQRILDQSVQQHNLQHKMEDLLSISQQQYHDTGNISEDLVSTYNKLHKLAEECMKHADTKCKKVHTRQVPFSPQTKKLKGEVVVWKAILKYQTGKKKNLRLVLRTAKRWGFDHRWGELSVRELKNNVKEARRQYVLYKPRVHEYQQTFLGNLAKDYADRDENRKDAAHHLPILIHQEDKRQAFQQIKFSLKPSRSGVSRVEIENDNGTRTLVCNKEGIEKEITRVNVDKLLQAENTPLRQEPLCLHFGEQGEFDKWDKIIHGTLRLPENYEAEEGTRLWLEYVRNTPVIEQKTQWTPEEYVDS